MRIDQKYAIFYPEYAFVRSLLQADDHFTLRKKTANDQKRASLKLLSLSIDPLKPFAFKAGATSSLEVLIGAIPDFSQIQFLKLNKYSKEVLNNFVFRIYKMAQLIEAKLDKELIEKQDAAEPLLTFILENPEFKINFNISYSQDFINSEPSYDILMRIKDQEEVYLRIEPCLERKKTNMPSSSFSADLDDVNRRGQTFTLQYKGDWRSTQRAQYKVVLEHSEAQENYDCYYDSHGDIFFENIAKDH